MQTQHQGDTPNESPSKGRMTRRTFLATGGKLAAVGVGGGALGAWWAQPGAAQDEASHLADLRTLEALHEVRAVETVLGPERQALVVEALPLLQDLGEFFQTQFGYTFSSSEVVVQRVTNALSTFHVVSAALHPGRGLAPNRKLVTSQLTVVFDAGGGGVLAGPAVSGVVAETVHAPQLGDGIDVLTATLDLDSGAVEHHAFTLTLGQGLDGLPQVLADRFGLEAEVFFEPATGVAARAASSAFVRKKKKCHICEILAASFLASGYVAAAGAAACLFLFEVCAGIASAIIAVASAAHFAAVSTIGLCEFVGIC